MKFTTVSRDPFSRSELQRFDQEPLFYDTGCSWCGGRSARGRLFKYRRQYDGGRVVVFPGAFCSVGCFRSYSG